MAYLGFWGLWFSRFIQVLGFTGNSLDLRKSRSSGSLASDLWDELAQVLQDVANRRLQKRKLQARKVRPNPPKTVKQLKATQKQKILLPEVGRQLAMLLDGLGGQKLWLEATAENLQWLVPQAQHLEVKPEAQAH